MHIATDDTSFSECRLIADGHAQVSVETAVSWLIAIAGRTATQEPMQPSEPDRAAAAALDALHLLFRDDAEHWRILSAQNAADVQRLRARMQDRGAAEGCAAAVSTWVSRFPSLWLSTCRRCLP